MKLLLLALVCLSEILFCTGQSFRLRPATQKDGPLVKWCVTSDQEMNKCSALAARDKMFSCVKKENTNECIMTIKNGVADAITLDGGDIYTAGLNDLQPIIAEDYGPTSDTCYYAVAVVKKSSNFTFNDLQGKKSCHTGLGKSAGWNIPIGTLLSMGKIKWAGIDDRPLEEAVSEFFMASCAPGADPGSKLCELCKGNCSRSNKEPYYGYDGAFKCLAEGAGEVAFVKHLTVPEAVQDSYELLCRDGSRTAISNYMSCYLAKVPAHAIVSRKDPDLANFIFAALSTVKGFNLFSSEGYGKNLMFKDSTRKLVKLPQGTDSFLYLGAEYLSIIRSLKKSNTSGAIKWCAVGTGETAKCDRWSSAEGSNVIECQDASTVDECLKKIMRGEADAMALDGGQVYTAGKCGLVPVMVEQYDEGLCSSPGSASSYYSVAVVKKNSGVTWENLLHKRSCHTGIGRTAGWNVPMGQIYNRTNNCNFTEFFSSGCAPGAEPNSTFCAQCVGSGKGVGDESKCKASADEQYYGYAGAFRCLVDGAGDVAFIKHTTVPDNSGGNGPTWAQNVKSSDYELICPGTPGSAPISGYASCNLAQVPAHAVVTRPETRNKVVRILKDQQTRDPRFRLFQSEGGKNFLFKDSTKCLQEIPAETTFQSFLGPEYMKAINMLRQCSDTASDLEQSCTFHSCQQKN